MNLTRGAAENAADSNRIGQTGQDFLWTEVCWLVGLGRWRVVGSPRLIRGDRWLVVGSPRLIRGVHWLVVGSPRLIRGDRWLVMGSPRLIRGDR